MLVWTDQSSEQTCALCRAPWAATTRASVSHGSAASKNGRAALPLARSSAESSVILQPNTLSCCRLQPVWLHSGHRAASAQ